MVNFYYFPTLLLDYEEQCILFKQIRPVKSVSLSSMRRVKAGLHFLWGAGGGRREEGRAGGGESSGKMETMLWRGDKWSPSVLATPGEDGHLRAHAANLIITLPEEWKLCFPPLCLSLCLLPVLCLFSHIYSSFLSPPSAFPWQNSVILIQFHPVHYTLKTLPVHTLKWTDCMTMN